MRVLVLLYEGMLPGSGVTVADAQWEDWKTEFHVLRSLKKLGHEVLPVEVDQSLEPLEKAIENFKPDIVFNLLEEFADEPAFDKHIVSYLELKNIPYTGCGPEGLLLCRDKALAKKILGHHGINTPQFFVSSRKQNKFNKDFECKFPMIVKSLTEEASMGLSHSSVVHNQERLEERIQFIKDQIGTDALVEEFVSGRELYVGAYEDKKGRLQLLPIWELSFGDLSGSDKAFATRKLKFDKKYIEKHGVRRGRARKLGSALEKSIYKMCREAWQALSLQGYCRFDFRLDGAGQPYLIEANPNPELAKGEDFANAASQAGLSYPDLIQSLLELGLRRDPRGGSRAA